MQELQQGATSTQYAKFLSKESIETKGGPGVKVTYLRLDGAKQAEQKVQYLVGKAKGSDLVSGAKPGDEFLVVKELKGQYWNLKEFQSTDKWTKPKPWHATQASAPKATGVSTIVNTSSNTRTFDDTGVKVGAARNQSIAFLAATRGTNFTLDDVDTIAYQIIGRQAAQEENVRNKTIPGATTTAQREELLEESFHRASLQDDDDEIPF